MLVRLIIDSQLYVIPRTGGALFPNMDVPSLVDGILNGWGCATLHATTSWWHRAPMWITGGCIYVNIYSKHSTGSAKLTPSPWSKSTWRFQAFALKLYVAPLCPMCAPSAFSTGQQIHLGSRVCLVGGSPRHDNVQNTPHLIQYHTGLLEAPLCWVAQPSSQPTNFLWDQSNLKLGWQSFATWPQASFLTNSAVFSC